MNNIKKIVHIADIHIRTFRMHDEYNEVFQNLYSSLREELKDFKYDEVRIVIVGDLVHQKITISNEQLMLCCDFLQKLSEIAPLIVVAGNHDLLENNKDRLDSITPIIQFLKNENIKYYKESICYEDENVVWCNYSIFEENKRPNIEESKEINKDKLHIGLFHGPLIGARTDIGYEFEHGTALEHFDGCDVVMLGDIHKIQEFNYRGIPIRYSGSLIQQNFGESIVNHGYSLWDLETKTIVHVEIPNENVFYQFKITSADDIVNDNEKLINK